MDSMEIHDVDLIQTDLNPHDQGSLYVTMTVEERDIIRIFRDFPVHLYEEWLDSDFDIDLYLSEIEPVFPFVEEDDDDD